MATAAPPTGVSNGALVRWAFDVINSHGITPLRAFWTPATSERFPDGTYQGEEALAGYFERLFAALPDVHLQVLTITEQGEDVFVHWHLTGTHSGAPFQGIAPTGRAIALDGIDHFVVRDGTVATNFVVFDQMQFARQIGLLPPDGSAGDRATKAAFNAKTRLLARLRRRPHRH
ncbi:hypothetical protein BH20ACT16_BH20ACT16_05450 [soil metagenome]|jgi:predicted ester cyclase